MHWTKAWDPLTNQSESEVVVRVHRGATLSPSTSVQAEPVTLSHAAAGSYYDINPPLIP